MRNHSSPRVGGQLRASVCGHTSLTPGRTRVVPPPPRVGCGGMARVGEGVWPCGLFWPWACFHGCGRGRVCGCGAMAEGLGVMWAWVWVCGRGLWSCVPIGPAPGGLCSPVWALGSLGPAFRWMARILAHPSVPVVCTLSFPTSFSSVFTPHVCPPSGPCTCSSRCA